MKNLFTLILFLLLFACQNPTKSSLQRKWKVDYNVGNFSTNDGWDAEHIDDDDKNPKMIQGYEHNLCDMMASFESKNLNEIEIKDDLIVFRYVWPKMGINKIIHQEKFKFEYDKTNPNVFYIYSQNQRKKTNNKYEAINPDYKVRGLISEDKSTGERWLKLTSDEGISFDLLGEW